MTYARTNFDLPRATDVTAVTLEQLTTVLGRIFTTASVEKVEQVDHGVQVHLSNSPDGVEKEHAEALVKGYLLGEFYYTFPQAKM